MKLTTNNHYQLHITLMILRRSMGQRSRSASNGHRNIVNAMPPPPTAEGSEPKLTQTSFHELIRFSRSRVQRSRSLKRFLAEAYGSPSTAIQFIR